jgi:hypothetical protein
MAAELAASERLNYLSKKQRAVSSRHSRQIINASNGNTFKPEQFTTIDIPGMQPATYMDFQNSYLRFTIDNKTGGALKLSSGYDLIQQIELLADGVTLSNIQNYNVLVDQYMSSEVGKEWKNNFGRNTVGIVDSVYDKTATFAGTNFNADLTGTMVGTNFKDSAGDDVSLAVLDNGTPVGTVSSAQGEKVRGTVTIPAAQGQSVTGTVTFEPDYGPIEIADSGKLVLCLPLVLTPLYSVNKYIPLVGRSTLTLRITWASGARAYNSDRTPAQFQNLEYSPIELISSQVRLSAEANQLVMANTRGVFELVCSDYRNALGFIDHSSTTAVAFTTGFSFSSFDRLSFSFYPHATLNANNAYSIRNRSKGGLTQFALAINGEEFPKKRIEVDSNNISEVLSELGLAHRSLADFNHQSHFTRANFLLDNADGSDKDNIGEFLAMLDLEAMQPHLGDSLYSGMTTTGSTVQLVGRLTSAGGGAKPMTCFMFANFTSALVLDMNGSAAWQMSL